MNAVALVERVKPDVLRLRDLPRLTEQQAAYKDYRLAGMKQIDAWRASYSHENYTEEAKHVQAWKTENNPKIRQWLDWHRLEAQEHSKVTLEGHLLDLMTVRDEARESRQYGPAVSAEKARGEAAGLYQKHATITHMSLENLPPTVGKLPNQVIEHVIDEDEENQELS